MQSAEAFVCICMADEPVLIPFQIAITQRLGA